MTIKKLGKPSKIICSQAESMVVKKTRLHTSVTKGKKILTVKASSISSILLYCRKHLVDVKHSPDFQGNKKKGINNVFSNDNN